MFFFYMGNRSSELERRNEHLQEELVYMRNKYNKIRDLLHVDVITQFVTTRGGNSGDLATICKYVGWIHENYNIHI